jgi:hypothetical protein
VINESLTYHICLFSCSFYLNSSSLTLTPTPHAGLVSSSGLIIRPTPAASDSYSDLALLSVKRILDSFRDIQNFGTKVPTNYLFIFHFYYQISYFDFIVSTKFHFVTDVFSACEVQCAHGDDHDPPRHGRGEGHDEGPSVLLPLPLILS